VIINNNGGHLSGGEVWIVESLDESQMIFSAEGLCSQLLASIWRKENYRVTQIDHRNFATVVEPPSMTNSGWDRHLPTGRDQEFRENSHDRFLHTW